VAEIVGAPLTHVLVAGYSNGYIHYVTTPEEYVAQRYEAGSTMYGRWELPALVQTAARLATAMRDGKPAERGTPPPDLSGRVKSRIKARPDVAAGGAYGDVLVAPRPAYRRGDTVRAEFVGAYPNNDLRRGGSYIEVQQRGVDGWHRVADDGDWATRFHWRRAGRSGSRVTVTWDVPATAEDGSYRLRYSGDVLEADGALRPISGCTGPFEVR
jgi:neutral ceramidase